MFHLRSNSSCRQHICLHYKEYQQRCADGNITENEHAIPRDVLAAKKGQVKLVQCDTQTSLDGTFMKVAVLRVFSREDVLKSIAEFVVCDDQVC